MLAAKDSWSGCPVWSAVRDKMRHSRDQRGRAEHKQLHVWVSSVVMVTTGITSGEVQGFGTRCGPGQRPCVCVRVPLPV